MHTSIKIVIVALSFYGGSVLAAGDSSKQPATAVVSPDAKNSDLNSRDKSGATATPQDQSNAPADRNLLAAVRKSIVHSKNLSTSAHNVKILVTDGLVTLRGPVNSEAEKTAVEKLAAHVAGVRRVDNQLDIATK